MCLFLDADECAIDNGDCAQLCINFPGSFECRCERGFEQGQDGNECTGEYTWLRLEISWSDCPKIHIHRPKLLVIGFTKNVRKCQYRWILTIGLIIMCYFDHGM